jgi:hypothetical protein
MHALAIFERKLDGLLANWSLDRNQAMTAQAQAFDLWFRPQINAAEILLHSIPIREAVLLVGDDSLFALILHPHTRLDALDADVDDFPNLALSAA